MVFSYYIFKIGTRAREELETVNFIVVAEHEGTIFTAEVHAPTLAVAEEFASIAGLYLFHPLAIAV